MKHVQLNDVTVAVDQIELIDESNLHDWIVYVKLRDETKYRIVSGFFAIELIYAVKPSALEGRRMRWKKHAWAIHNIIAHPLMQILAFIHCYKLAIWLHDVTVPKPVL